jgi:hypothetical protein
MPRIATFRLEVAGMEVLTFLVTLAEGIVLFLVLFGLTLLVERTSSEESAGRSVSGSARATTAQN